VSSDRAFFALFGLIVIFFICVIWHLSLMRRIVRSSGGKWDINSPFQRVSEERKALRTLPKGTLRNEWRLLKIVAWSSWLFAMVILILHQHKK
jgi:hypothetical protein